MPLPTSCILRCMSGITSEDVTKLAHLARLDVADAEIEALTHDLHSILAAVETMREAVDESIPPTSHPVPLANVTRPDVVRPGLTQDAALAGAPDAEGGRFRVPRILDEE